MARFSLSRRMIRAASWWRRWWPWHKRAPRPAKAILRGQAADTEFHGGWYFKTGLLDELGDYFKHIRYLKIHYPDAYTVFSRIGAIICSRHEKTRLYDPHSLPARWRSGDARPSFGAITFLGHGLIDKTEFFTPKFGIFFRYAGAVHNVQSLPGTDIFSVVWFYSHRDPKSNLRFPFHFFVAVDPQGRITLLKELERRGRLVLRKRHGGKVLIPAVAWNYPPALVEDFKEIKAKQKEGKGWQTRTIEDWAAQLFRLLINAHDGAGSAGIRVAVNKGAVAGAFFIDMLRSPYFFADRDTTVNHEGQKQRIFHIVRTHSRTLADGREIPVRSHFRGLRHFDWNGYRIQITMPGYHHGDLLDLDVPAHDTAPNVIGKDWVTLRQCAKAIQDHLEGRRRAA